jgi:acetoin utilization protein AcuB
MNAAPNLPEPPTLATVTVGDLMSRRLVTIDPEAPLSQARDLFEKHRFHHILVTEGTRLVGIMSDRDLLKGLSPFVDTMAERTLDVDTLKRKVHTLMQRKVITTPASATLAASAARIVKHGISSLPVLDAQGALVGIVTWKDILRWLVHEAQGPAGLSLAPKPR